MALSMQEQFDLAMRSISTGDVDLASKLLTDPASITPEENRTVAEKWGLKHGFLSWAVNVVSDPTVWVAYLLQRHFPTGQWLRGTIPERFAGAGSEYTGISQFTRPIETMFRGGIIPRLTALKQQREQEVMNVGRLMFDRFQNRPNWQEEMPIVSMILEGQAPAGATSELRTLAKGIRGDMDELWGFLARSQKIRGGFDDPGHITKAQATVFNGAETPQYLRDYLPHIPLLGDESIMRASGVDALKRLMGNKSAQAMQAAGITARDVWTPNAADRLSSQWGRFQEFLNATQGEIYNPRLFKRMRWGTLQSSTGQDMWVTDLNIILEKYLHSVARTYSVNAPISDFERALASVRREDGSWDRPTNEPIIVQLINRGLKEVGVSFGQRPVKGTEHIDEVVIPNSGSAVKLTALEHLVRSVSGRADHGEIMWGNLFSTIGMEFEKKARMLTGKQLSELDYGLKSAKWNRSYRSVMNGISSHFYASTLGMNPWSTIQNLLQPMLTTAPTIGIGPTLAGMGELRRRIPLYASELRAQHAVLKGSSPNALHRINEAAQGAFERVFPELVRSGIKLDPRLFELDPAGLTGSGISRWFRNVDDFYKFMLQPFTHAEMANQATTFFGAKEAIKRAIRSGEYEMPVGVEGKSLAGDALEQWMNFEAGNVVNQTQFRPGPGSRTIWQGKVPAPFRMFTSFPIRALSFMTESTVRGAMTAKQLEGAGLMTRLTGGRNWGTLTRMYLYGRIGVEGAREVLGIDLANALGVTAPFNIAPQGKPFAPYSIPPIAGLTYGLLSAATTRDIKEMQPLYLPGVGDVPIPKTLIPGGLALSRAVRAAQQFRPDIGGFVDDDERLMYRGNTTDLIFSMLGIPTEKNRRVRDRMDRVQSLRDSVRRFRRAYAVAATNGDVAGMTALKAQWAKAYPDWPALNISDRDLKRYQTTARMPMLQRMVQTSGQMGSYLESDLYEYDEDLLAPRTDPLSQLMGAP